MSEHTKEPWRYTPSETEEDDGSTYEVTGARITGADSESIFRIDLGDVAGLDDANARRIVACVNACAGIETEYLEAMRGTSILAKANASFDAVKAQRDRLLEALKLYMHAGFGNSTDFRRQCEAYDHAVKAIDNVTRPTDITEPAEVAK